MEITRENTGDMTATVRIAISPAEYTENVNKVLKDYQRKANVPGFRPGHVPFGMIKKMYGSAVFADEVNKLVSDSLNSYITEEKLEILGQPLPNMERTPVFDWKEEKEIEFFFDLGYSPAFELILDDSISLEYPVIKVSEEMLDKYIVDMQQRFGKMGNPEISSEKDVLNGEFTELDEEGNVLEDGISHSSKLLIDTVQDETIKKLLLGLKAGDSVIFNPSKASGNLTETASMLGITKERAENLNSDFHFTVNEITNIEPAALNEELYNQVFPEAGITDEAAFRDKIRAESEQSFVPDSDHLFMHTVQEKLMENTAMPLPDAFLKRWLLESNDGKITAEDLEQDYHKYADSMKWQLLENRMIKDFGIEVGDDEIKDFVKDRYLPGWRNMPLTTDLASRLETLANTFLETRHDEVRRIIDGLYEVRIATLVKSKVNLVEKEISYEDFVSLDALKH